jgi:hypothetical protein
MATFKWEVYADTPDWMDVSTDTIVFAGSGGLDTPITVGTWQDETHLGDGDPGADQCGANHVPNVKYISGTQFDSGGGTESLNDSNLAETECTMRIEFTDASSVVTTNGRFYSFDGATETNEAVEIEAYAFERGVSATAWTQINDDSGNVGGDNGGERLPLTDQSTGQTHYFYIAVSAQPQSVGAKDEFDFGIALTYS